VREREQQAVQQAVQQTGELEAGASLSLPLDLLQRARNSEGDERLQLAGRLNELMRKSASDPNRESWAKFLVDMLEDKGFHDLYDGDGVSCRAVAAQAILTFGFPYALHLHPDDLDYLRTVSPNTTAPGGWRAMAVVTGVLAALFALAFFIHL